MEKIKALLKNKKVIIAVVLTILILIGSVYACVFALTSSDDKKDSNGGNIETVVSEDEDTKDDTSDTSSKPSTTDGDNDTESKPEDTSSEEDDYDFLNDFEEDDYIITEEDNVGNLSKETVKIIKELYLKNTGSNIIKIKNIKISRYYGTLSDGSIAVAIDMINISGPLVKDKLNKVFVINDHIYYASLGPIIYKNNKLQTLETAYENGTISTKIVDEFFSKHSYLDISNIYLSEKDNCTGMEYLDICYAKQSYREELRKEDLNISDLVINDYYGKLKENCDIVLLGLKETESESVTEQIGKYKYTHPEDQGVYVYYSSKSNYLNSSYFWSSKIEDLLSAYKYKLITDEELDKIAKHYPQYFIVDDE